MNIISYLDNVQSRHGFSQKIKKVAYASTVEPV